MPGAGGRVYVIDSSSVIELKERANLNSSDCKRVLSVLAHLVDSGEMVYPSQVARELTEGGRPDVCSEWVEATKKRATRFAPPLELVAEVLRAAPTLIDTDRPSGKEQADPYVIALALHLVRTGEAERATVVAEEKNDRRGNDTRRGRLTIRTVAGMLDVPSMTHVGLLERVGWP